VQAVDKAGFGPTGELMQTRDFPVCENFKQLIEQFGEILR
jgi:hypothetical protein